MERVYCILSSLTVMIKISESIRLYNLLKYRPSFCSAILVVD